VVNYVNDKRDGKWLAWYWHGQIKTEVNHKNGNLEGRQTEYFENGQIDMEGIFKDGNYLRNGRRSGSLELD
jgi:antitoxin component YwqK of YwqJK toxin-antitoxin module